MTNPFADANEQAQRAAQTSQTTLGTVQSVAPEGHAVLVRPDSAEEGSDPITAFVVEQYAGDSSLPSQGDRVAIQRLTNNTALMLGVVYGDKGDVPNSESRQLSDIDVGAPKTIAQYAAYWNEADELIAADDASSRSLLLGSQILDSGDITVTKAATLLGNDAVPYVGSFTAVDMSTLWLYSIDADNRLSQQKAHDIALEGEFGWEKVATTLYGARSTNNELLTDDQRGSIIADATLLSDSDMAKAITPGIDSDGAIFYGSYAETLYEHITSTNVTDGRISTLWNTGSLQTVNNDDSTYDDKIGQIWGVLITAPSPSVAAANLDNDLYPDVRTDWMMEFADTSISNGYFTYDELASVYDDANLSVTVAITKFGDSNGNTARSGVVRSNNFSVSRAASFWNEASVTGDFPVADTWEEIALNGADQKLASSIDDSNLTEANAENIWSNTIFTDSDAADITEHLTDVEKPLQFGEQWYHVTTSSPDSDPRGIGGNSQVVYHTDNNVDMLYELSTSDLSVVRSAATPIETPRGIGGTTNTVWFVSNFDDKVYELDPSDFSVVRSDNAPGGSPTGIGGDDNTIWHSQDSNDVYELDTTDFSVIRQSTTSGNSASGIGGDSNSIYVGDSFDDIVRELDTSDFSTVRSRTAYDSPKGIGGDGNTIWYTDNIEAVNYRLAEDS
jgi:hypothetical protein